MFEIDSERMSLPLPPDRIVALVSSLNTPMVVAADMPVEPTRAYICAYRDRGDEVAFSIYLHRVESNKGAFYRYDGGAVPRGRFDDVMGEAMAFAESLGFMMDDLGWERLDRARREELTRETPIFLEPEARAQAAAPVPGVEEPAAELIVDETTEAGVVGATPISPVLDPPAPPSAVPEAPQAGAPPGPPLATAFVPPPTGALPAGPSASPARALPGAPHSSARAQAGGAHAASPARRESAAPQSGSPARAEPAAAQSSGTRELELVLDAPAPAEPVEPSPSPSVETARARASSAARREAGGPPGSPAGAAGALGPIPGAAAAAQALVRLLSSL